MHLESIFGYLLALLAAPLFFGIINRVKAFFAGRRGQSCFQLYYDLIKLLHKGAVYSKTTTALFRVGPLAGLVGILLALAFIPHGMPPLLAFPGDFICMAYLLGVLRFCTVVAALDTGSSFEGMGASREVLFAAMAEPAFLLGMFVLMQATGQLSFSSAAAAFHSALTPATKPAVILLFAAWLIVFLAENARIPFDDPNTHLELTMIHEVMVLDHSGPDFAAILYSAALKMWVFGAILVNLVMPRPDSPLAGAALMLAGMCLLAVLVGVVESTMARLRLRRVPQLLVAGSAFSILALLLILRQ